jgi:hypothetical protein
MSIQNIFDEIKTERCKQDTKWGEQNHHSVDPTIEDRGGQRVCQEYEIPSEARAKFLCDNAAKYNRCTYAHIAVEELCEAVGASGDIQRRVELVQLAAVIVAWIECIDRRQNKCI